jgi:hypothetical protein
VVEHNHSRPNATTPNCKEPRKTNHLDLAVHLHTAGQATEGPNDYEYEKENVVHLGICYIFGSDSARVRAAI